MNKVFGGDIMICYNRKDIEEMKDFEGEFYMPNALFNTMQYKLVRLEVKFGYTACLNALLKEPSFNEADKAYVLADNPLITEILKSLAHKPAAQEKINGYLDELEDAGLLERNGNEIYLKKVCNIF